ncbi:MAG TPA: succinate dehydrogenase cytochrome b subunit [Gemmatimonadaceae bacterium]|nr:succinate dehydrogenase cytochrome b subunit [Gemmatimonadaceae bacterium]
MATGRGFYRSLVGKKIVMGVTGLIWVGFVVGHAAGNLLVFRGPEALNSYSEFLKSTGELLWIVRAVLVVSLVLHVIAAVQATRQSRAARPVGYAKQEYQAATFASRTMRWGGALLLVFIVLHVLHFTTGTVQPAGSFSTTDVYTNMVTSFRIWWVALFYVVSMAALGLHLFHGAWSSVRSIGVRAVSADPLKKKVALGLALVLWLAFTAIPVAIFAGLIG